VALGRRLRAGHKLAEKLLLDLDALLEGQVHRRLDALDVVFGRKKAAELARIGLAEGGEDFGFPARRLDLLVEVADLAQGAALGEDFPRKGDGALAQPAFLGKLIDKPHLLAGRGRHMRACRHHFERLFRTDNARQTLRSARAGQEAQIDLGQAASGRGNGDPVMAGERHFEAAAQRRAVNGGDDGLGRILDHGLGVEQAWPLGRLAEFGDVRARDKGLAVANKNDRLDGGVRDGPGDAFADRLAHGRRKRIHGGRVQGQDPDIALDGEIADRVDCRHDFLSLNSGSRLFVLLAKF